MYTEESKNKLTIKAIFLDFGYSKATIRSLKCSWSRWNISLAWWGGAPSCMNYMLSKSGSLWITGINWFLNISMYRAELTVRSKKIGLTMPWLESAHQKVQGVVSSQLRSEDSRYLRCANLPIHIPIEMKMGLNAISEHTDIKLVIVNHFDDSVRKFQAFFYWWLA